MKDNLTIINEHLVPSGQKKQRLQEYAYLAFQLNIPSKKGVKKAIKKGCIYLDGKIGQTGDWVTEGMILQLIENQNYLPKRYEEQLNILFEDDFIAVINKPAGVLVSGNQYRTIVNMLSYNLNPSSQKDKLLYPTPVHRLDKATSGCLIIAKTKSSQIHFNRLFTTQSISKTYQALVIGKTPIEGSIQLHINQQVAKTTFERLKLIPSLKCKYISHLKLKPSTGRTHQLRIHCNDMGHPILGDKIYSGSGSQIKKKGMFLHAASLKFNHPIENTMVLVESLIPNKFERYLHHQMKSWHKFSN